MDTTIDADARHVQEKIHALRASNKLPADREALAATIDVALDGCFRQLAARDYQIVFIGPVGVGKSSLIAMIGRLFVGQAPTDRVTLKDSSVLAVGSGRTTICEIRVRARREGDGGKMGLVIDRLDDKLLKREIELYAQDEWARRKPSEPGTIEDDANPGQEVQRAIRAMTGYQEHTETYHDETGARRRRIVRPIEGIIAQCDSAQAFAAHLVDRIDLPSRQRTEWWFNGDDLECLAGLKARFEAINGGVEPTATLPTRMTVVVPTPLPDSASGMSLTLIDTRGLDGRVEARRDLRQLLRAPLSIPIICAPFNEAPGDAIRALLAATASDVELRLTLAEAALVILDHGDAEQVNGAEGMREVGQDLKVDECRIALEHSGMLRGLAVPSRIVAFDALKDPPSRLVALFDELIQARRNRWKETLAEFVRHGQSFIESVDNELLRPLRQAVDDRVRRALASRPLDGAPLEDALDGLYDVISGCRYASVVRAMCRRGGRYPTLDAIAAVGSEAATAASQWLDPLTIAVEEALAALEKEPDYAAVQDYIALRRMQFVEGRRKAILDYAGRVSDQVEDHLIDADVWVACSGEWGRGSGFKDRVIAHLEQWSSQSQALTAHTQFDAAQFLPLLHEVLAQASAPRFTLHVRNLRALRQCEFTSEQVSVIVGGNGTGKTTILQCLRLLGAAYEKDLPEAVTTVLYGSADLRTWGTDKEEPIEVGVDLGDLSYRIELTPREGTVDYLARERLFTPSQEIFVRDSLGNFHYRGDRITDSDRRTALAALASRGVHDPLLRRMASFLENINYHHDADLWSLRQMGSRTSESQRLHSRSQNALTILRRFSQDPSQRSRYDFVIDGLRAAFPKTFYDLGFIEAGGTLAAQVYRKGQELPCPLQLEASGVASLLVSLTAVANTERGGVVAIDEPEHCLHPYALRSFLRRVTRWAKKQDITVILATHSTVLLDELNDHPEQVFVTKGLSEDAPIPTRLDALCNRDWLRSFKLGEHYESGEIGSNEDDL